MSTKFTPGLWTYGVRENGTIWQSRGDPAKGPHWQDDFYGTEADARLIAAAPDMLEALRKAEMALASYETTRVGVHHTALADVRAAIAKAEGRS